MADVYFTWGSNFEERAQRDVGTLQRFQAEVQRIQAQIAAGGGSQRSAQFLDAFSAQVNQTHRQVIDRARDLQRRVDEAIQTAQRTGRPFAMPGGEALRTQYEEMARTAGAGVRRNLQTALNAVPRELEGSFDAARLGREAGRGMYVALNDIQRQTLEAMRQAGVAGRAPLGLAPGSQFVRDWERTLPTRATIDRGDPLEVARAQAQMAQGLGQESRQHLRTEAQARKQTADEAVAMERQKRRELARELGERVLSGRARQTRESEIVMGQQAWQIRRPAVGGRIVPEAHEVTDPRDLANALRRRAALEEQITNQTRDARVGEANRELARTTRRRIRTEGVGTQPGQLFPLGQQRFFDPQRERVTEFTDRSRLLARDTTTADQVNAARTRYARALDAAASRARREAVAPQPMLGGAPGGGGVIGRGMTIMQDRGGLDPESVLGAGGRLIRYTALATGIGALLAVMRDTKREAVDYAESVTDLEVAMGNASGVADGFREDLQEISRLAGSNVAQAMDSAARSIRAFADVGRDGQAMIEEIGESGARAAERLAVIADKDISSAMGDIIAIGASYELQADELERINEAIAGAKALGGVPEQTAQGLSNGAIALREAGFGISEAASILSVVQARLDQTGQATATRLARVFQIARGGQAQAAFAGIGIEGDTVRDQIAALAEMEAQGELTEGQLQRLMYVLGGTANTRELIALLRNWESVQQNVNDQITNGGRATDEYNRKINNLSGLLRRIRGDLANLQTGALEAGLFAPIGVALTALEPALRTLGQLLNLYNRLPDSLRMATTLTLQFVAAQRLLARVTTSRVIGSIQAEAGPVAGVAGGRVLGAEYSRRQRERIGQEMARRGVPTAPLPSREIEQEARATQRLTRAKTAETTARAANTNAVRGETVAKTQGTAVTTANTAADFRSATTKQASTLARLRHAAAIQAETLAMRAQTAAQGAPAAMAGFARSPMGLLTGAMVGAMAFQAINDALDRVSKAADSSASALDQLTRASTPDALEESAQALSAAANEYRQSVEGVTGATLQRMLHPETAGEIEGWQGTVGRLLGRAAETQLLGITARPARAGLRRWGPDELAEDPLVLAERNQRAAEATAEFGQELTEVREQLARAGDAAALGLTPSIEELEIGLEKFEATGQLAVTQAEALIEAVRSFGEVAEGTVRPGAALQTGLDIFSAELGETGQTLVDQLAEHLADQVAEEAGGGGLRERLRHGRALRREGTLEHALRELQRAEADVESARAGGDVDQVAMAERRYAEARADAIREGEARRQQLVADAAAQIDAQVDPEQMQRMQQDAARAFADYVSEIGLEEGGVMTDAQMAEAARRQAEVAARYLDVDPEVLAGFFEERFRELTGGGQELDQPTSDFLQQRQIQFAGIVERHAQITTGDSVQAAQEGLRVLEGLRDEIEASDTELMPLYELALVEWERKVADAMEARARARAQMVIEMLDETDVAGRTAAELAEVNRQLQVAIERGDIEAEYALRGQAAAMGRRQEREERQRVDAYARAMVDPRDALRRAETDLAAAERELSDTERYDSFGRTTQAWSEALQRRNEAAQQVTDLQAQAADAAAMAALDPRDTLGQAREELAAAQRQLERLVPESAEYWQQYRRVQDLQVALARAEAEAAAAARAAATDPRDEVENAWNAVLDAYDALAAELPGTPGHDRARRQAREAELRLAETQRARVQAQRRVGIDPRDRLALSEDDLRSAMEDLMATRPNTRERAEAQQRLNELSLEDARLRREYAAAARAGVLDPRDTLGQAREQMRQARDAMRDELYGSPEYWQAYQEYAQAQLEYAQAQRSRRAARARAGADPRSAVQNARLDMREAAAAMRAALPGDEEYYQALRQYREAQIAYADAVAQAASTRRMLAIDISDPVATAREELRTARQATRRARRQGAPQDVINDLLLEERRQELSAEQAAFDQRFRDAQTANELGRISHAAYIRYLNSEATRLRNIHRRTRQQQEQLDQVERALKTANDQMQGQWNIGDIRIPTPYEVRRSIEARTAGMGYSDAATVSSVVHNTVQINGADLVQVKQFLTQLLGPQAMGATAVANRKI